MNLFNRRKLPNQRERYRVRVGKTLTVSIRKDDRWVHIRPLDLSSTGAAILVAQEDAGLHPKNSTMELRFALRGRAAVVTAMARVANSAPFEDHEGPAQKLGLAFLDVEKLHAELDPVLWMYFNRREDYRVDAPEDCPPVVIRWRDKELTGALGNISAQGIAVFFEPSTQILLLPGMEAVASVPLPETQNTAILVTKVIHRVLHASSPHVGFEMDAERSPEFESAQDQIHHYVVKRQREEIRQQP